MTITIQLDQEFKRKRMHEGHSPEAQGYVDQG